MGISDAERLRELFDEVISRPPAEREAFIDVACAADDELRGRLRSLVSNSIEDTLFESPSDADTIIESMRRAIRRTVEPPFRERQRVGPYVIHEILGTGGTSVVYRATQESPVRREVAVKVIKPGMDSEAVLARFDRERYVLAMMEHPNIAKIFDAGATPNGRPYFVMELIRGEPVTAYADRLKLDDDRRIALFLDICRAMQHAHMRG
ncbi:MAG: serine/threonine protein kinase, partial [Planctomycetota bacterium]